MPSSFRSAEQGNQEHDHRDHFQPAHPHENDEDPFREDGHLVRYIPGTHTAGGECGYGLKDNVGNRV